MSENVKVIRDMYDASARGDFPAAMASWAPDISWNVAESHPYAEGNPYVGVEAIAGQLLAKMGEHMPEIVTEITEMLDAGDKVIVLGRYRGPVKTTNKMFDAQMAHIWTLQQGKIIHFQQLVDTKQLNEVLQHD